MFGFVNGQTITGHHIVNLSNLGLTGINKNDVDDSRDNLNIGEKFSA